MCRTLYLGKSVTDKTDGRATVATLRINAPERVRLGQILIAAGLLYEQ